MHAKLRGEVTDMKRCAIHTSGPKASWHYNGCYPMVKCVFAGRTGPPMQQQTLQCWQKALQDASLHASAPAQASQADALLSILQEASR